jgi:hypothetical protein
MVYLKKIWNAIISVLKSMWQIIIWPYTKIKEELAFRKKMKELKKRDPFIYK